METTIPALFGAKLPQESEKDFTSRRSEGRKYLTSFDLSDIGVFWYDVFCENIEDHLPRAGIKECVPVLLDRVDREVRHTSLVQSILGKLASGEPLQRNSGSGNANPPGSAPASSSILPTDPSDLICLCDRTDQDEFLIDSALGTHEACLPHDPRRPYLIVVPGPPDELHDMYRRRFYLETAQRLHSSLELPGKPHIFQVRDLGQHGEFAHRFSRLLLEPVLGKASGKTTIKEFVASILPRSEYSCLWFFLDLNSQHFKKDPDLLQSVVSELAQIVEIPAACCFGVLLTAQCEPASWLARMPFWKLSRDATLSSLEAAKAKFGEGAEVNYWQVPDLGPPSQDDLQRWCDRDVIKPRIIRIGKIGLSEVVFGGVGKLPMKMLAERLRQHLFA